MFRASYEMSVIKKGKRKKMGNIKGNVYDFYGINGIILPDNGQL